VRRATLGEKVLDSPINWKLAVDTFSENYHFATVHRATFAAIARSNCTVFDSFGPHHRLIFPLNSILELDNVPEDQWDPFQNMVVIYALFPNIVLSVTIANGELFRIYRGQKPGRSITVHQNSTPLDISEESVAAGAQAVFDYAHAAVPSRVKRARRREDVSRRLNPSRTTPRSGRPERLRARRSFQSAGRSTTAAPHGDCPRPPTVELDRPLTASRYPLVRRSSQPRPARRPAPNPDIAPATAR
jgi:phenylpropionate dioxygenase-like ring-hydroxylating dioxygenase large terminal subunit